MQMSGEAGYQTKARAGTKIKMVGLLPVDVGSRIKGTDIAYMDNFRGKLVRK
jgi:hypothetical protein